MSKTFSKLDMKVLKELDFLAAPVCFHDLVIMLRLEGDMRISMSRKPEMLKYLLLRIPSNRTAISIALEHLKEDGFVKEEEPATLLEQILPRNRALRDAQRYRLTSKGKRFADYCVLN